MGAQPNLQVLTIADCEAFDTVRLDASGLSRLTQLSGLRLDSTSPLTGTGPCTQPQPAQPAAHSQWGAPAPPVRPDSPGDAAPQWRQCGGPTQQPGTPLIPTPAQGAVLPGPRQQLGPGQQHLTPGCPHSTQSPRCCIPDLQPITALAGLQFLAMVQPLRLRGLRHLCTTCSGCQLLRSCQCTVCHARSDPLMVAGEILVHTSIRCVFDDQTHCCFQQRSCYRRRIRFVKQLP